MINFTQTACAFSILGLILTVQIAYLKLAWRFALLKIDMICKKSGSSPELVHYFEHQSKWASLDLTHKAKIAEVLLESEAAA